MGVLTDFISRVLKTSAIPMDVYSVQLRPTLCDPMDCNMPGLSVHHQLPEFTQIHVRWVGDAIQPSHPLSSPSPPALNLFQHQGLFKWFSSLHQVAKVLRVSASTSVLPMNTQDWSPCCPRDSQESSPTPQFKSINSLALSFLYSSALTSPPLFTIPW